MTPAAPVCGPAPLTLPSVGVLTRSVAPNDGESLASHVLRLAERLARSPADVCRLTGLAAGPTREVPAYRSHLVDPARLAEYAAATRMTYAEARSLTLQDAYAALLLGRGGAYEPNAPGHQRLRTHWIQAGLTRACPECLAGPHAFWRKTWQMPWHFVCVDHGRLLLSTCPACRTPFGRERGRGPEGQLVPSPSVTGLAVGACRGTSSETRHSKHNRIPRCGQPVGGPAGLALSAKIDDPLVIDVQRRLLHAMTRPPEDRLPVAAVQLPTTAWFEALRALCGLLRLARPDTPLVPLPVPLAQALSDLDDERRSIGDDRAAVKALVSPGTPPGSPALLGALAVQALHLLDSPDWDALVAETAPLRREAREREHDIVRRPLPGLRPDVRRLVRGEVGDGLLNTWLVLAPATVRQEWTFRAAHVPQRLDGDAHRRHFTAFEDLEPGGRHNAAHRLRRCAAVALVEMSHQVSQREALALLGVPSHCGYANNLARLDAALARTGRAPEFRRALQAAAQEIEDDPDRTDHGARRNALATWTIPQQDWNRLVTALRPLQYQGRAADWGEQRRLCTTAVLWEHMTGGEAAAAPFLADIPLHDRRRFFGYLSNYRTRLHSGGVAGWETVLVPYARRLSDQIETRARSSVPSG